jgi:hypothetical protein
MLVFLVFLLEVVINLPYDSAALLRGTSCTGASYVAPRCSQLFAPPRRARDACEREIIFGGQIPGLLGSHIPPNAPARGCLLRRAIRRPSGAAFQFGL